jgi:hypothetical protein
MMFVEQSFQSDHTARPIKGRVVASATIAVLGAAVLLLGILPQALTDLIAHSLP